MEVETTYPVSLQITTMLGQVVAAYKCNVGTNYINLNYLVPGSYVARLEHNTRLFIKY